MRYIAAFLLLILLGAPTLLHADLVAAPTNLTVQWTNLYGTQRSYYLEWTDKSSIETSFEIQAATTNPPTNWQTVGTALPKTEQAPSTQSWERPLGTTSSFVIFRVRSVNGTDRGDSNSVLVNHATAVFQKPSGLTVTTLSDQALKLDWNDHSNAEDGVEIWGRVGSTANFGYLGDQYYFHPRTLTFTGLSAATTYQFQIRAFRFVRNTTTGDIIIEEGVEKREYTHSDPLATFTATASGTTAGFSGAPTTFEATATSETDVRFTWADPLFSESGFELQYAVPLTQGTTPFSWFYRVQADTTTLTDGGLTPEGIYRWIPGNTYHFRVRAFSTADDTSNNPANWIFSAPSSVAAVTFPFHKPTNVGAANITSSSATLTWADNSAVETGYQVWARLAGQGEYKFWDYTAANQTSLVLSGLPSGTSLEFVVFAFYEFETGDGYRYSYSDDSTPLVLTTKDNFTSLPHAQGTVGSQLSYQLATTTVSPRTSWNITALPSGWNFNSATGVLTGTPTAAGVLTFPTTATFQNGWVINSTLTIRSLNAPAAPVYTSLPGAQLISRGQTNQIPLGDYFEDLEGQSAVKVTTNFGSFNMLLYPVVAPQTVANFLAYVNDPDATKNFTDTLFHRADPAFVIQGGGFKLAGVDSFTSVVTRPSPLNEPGISNTRGTVSMAKLGTNPNSATCQFFVNLHDNSANLNAQNGGFTVFGRVAGGMTVPDAISATPTSTRPLTIDDVPTVEPYHLDFIPTTPVIIQSITPTNMLEFTVTGNTNPSVVSATISNGELLLTGLTPGTSTITYRVKDLDGNELPPFQLPVTIEQTSTDFLQLASLPAGKNGLTDDADSDGLTNFEEFAFMGSLTASDDATVRPKAITVNVNGVDHQAIQFKARKFAADVIYQVEVSGTLMPNSWTNVWNWQVNSTPPSASPNSAVINTPPRVDDMGDHYRITILDPTPATPGNPRFLRVKLIRVTPPAPTPA